ncbi:hypothetical protein [Pseudophaeobacter sp.]|uniref:hypothetical protein n=1 Tax=Pseudophaeobacter sp. TaxID=1971739 RepID=UPI00326332DD
MSKQIEVLLRKIKGRLIGGDYPNEASVSFGILAPLLRSLGWDETDPLQVMPEYSSGGRRVDFALCSSPERPAIFIEVKSVGRSLAGDRQLFEYAFHEGIPFCVLTDGRDWNFYLPSGQGSYDERRVYRLSLTDRNESDSARALERYLGRERVVSGAALDDATRQYRKMASSREAKRAIPEAWSKLVSEREDLLIEIIVDQVEAICGSRPPGGDVEAFLDELSPMEQSKAADSSVAKTAKPSAVPKTTKEKHSSVAFTRPSSDTVRVKSELIYFVFGEKRTARSAKELMLDVLREIARKRPDCIEEISVAVSGRSRNHIARTAEEIYPKRPDLARAEEFSPGWLVGLNIANREKLRILKIACSVAGFSFGSDVRAELPNT